MRHGVDAHKSLTASIAFAVGSLIPDLQVLFVGVAENDRTVSGNRHRKISSTGNNAVAPHFAFIIGSRFRQIKLGDGELTFRFAGCVGVGAMRHSRDCRNRHKIEPPREEHNTSFAQGCRSEGLAAPHYY